MTLAQRFTRKFFIVPTVKEYLDSAVEWLFPDRYVVDHWIYNKAVAFVLNEKAPLLFVPSNDAEKMTFTAPYGIIPMPRSTGKYANPTMLSLANLHDFIHALFGYPLNIKQTTVDQFDEDMMIREAVASNATEVLIHYDLPGLRGRIADVLPRIWFDILYFDLDQRSRPSVAQILRLRRDWLKSNAYDWIYCRNNPDHPVAKFMARWRMGNEIYWHKRLKKLIEMPELRVASVRSLGPTMYEEELAEYSPRTLSQSEYEKLQMHYARALYAIAGRNRQHPPDFESLLKRQDELEDLQVIIT